MTEQHFYKVALLNSIHDISASDWDELWPDNSPFHRHGFFAALEDSGCTSQESGWKPQHLLLRRGDKVVAAMPLYLKFHSYGEYVFDWAWADAYRRNGLDYYPKLLSAIPFTPATGARIGIANHVDASEVYQHISEFLNHHCQEQGISSWHCLFHREEDRPFWNDQVTLERRGCQFHWVNRGYADFADFLGHFNSRKRKAVRRERQQVRDYHIQLDRLVGKAITKEDWDQFYLHYHTTYLKRSGGTGYLNREFFQALAANLGEQVLMVTAALKGERIASALCLFDENSLYGRYWGCLEEVPGLHFEACYYQGIEFAIEKGLCRFDPGAQGEHKIQRGFEPTLTWSQHWIADPRFSAAIEDFLHRETPGINDYREDCASYLPFRQSD
ncbi:N-acetyltransferase [Pseudomaricurvus alkylphenolicus]|uniref:GNAT family N-acetyltransferase n=1 Tax=Pseudomaricurvus alkylphenolicus TaxID=1306991 RepID=UPI0014247D85|nr:GNAT family N-acetyltransferase [Pseudomaricurvus alkylphenolicus]NIB39455.1 N-acetyltransferase [Pseudomaricurvus alkylphenolicus]